MYRHHQNLSLTQSRLGRPRTTIACSFASSPSFEAERGVSSSSLQVLLARVPNARDHAHDRDRDFLLVRAALVIHPSFFAATLVHAGVILRGHVLYDALIYHVLGRVVLVARALIINARLARALALVLFVVATVVPALAEYTVRVAHVHAASDE